MNSAEKWRYFLDKYEAAKQTFDIAALDDEVRKDFEFIERMLLRTLKSSNKRCDMTLRSGLDPANLTYFIKQMFWLRGHEKFSAAREHITQQYTWYPDYQLADLQGDFWRMNQERWQIHARIGTLFLTVDKCIEIDFGAIGAHSDAYTVVVYRDGKEAVAKAGSQGAQAAFRIPLEKGEYVLVLRFYSDDHELYCPAVLVDGEIEVPVFHDKNTSRFKKYLDFWMNQPPNPVFLMQNLHTFYWLRFEREKMPEEVWHDFLCVANPDTRWEYGYLERGRSVWLQLSKQALAQFRVYVTFVNEMSLPVYGAQVRGEDYQSIAMPVDGAFHIRFVLRGKLPQSGFPPLHYRFGV